MAYNLSVREAAQLLSISEGRVKQLIAQDVLDAEKIGGRWVLSSESVSRRKEQTPRVGRPRTSSASEQSYTLMNRTHEVLDFTFDSVHNKFRDAHHIIDPTRAPLGLVSPRGAKVSAGALAFWWQHRAIPVSRDGLSAKLEELGIEHASQLPFKNLGLSLSDQYWVKPHGSSLDWHDINYFENTFSSLEEAAWLSGIGLNSPDNTSEGQLPKRWVCRRGKRVLYKGSGPLGQEPYNEAVATALYKRLSPPQGFVPYQLKNLNNETVSTCEVFLANDEEYIPAYYVKQQLAQPNHRNDYHHYLECCAHFGVGDAERYLAYMLVCDTIMANHDRHWRNFGLVRNVETLEYRWAPLFDTGSSLWCNATQTQLQREDFRFSAKPFYEDPLRQLRLVGDYSWLDMHSLEGFAAQAEEILAQSNQLKERAAFVAKGIDYWIWRISALL